MRRKTRRTPQCHDDDVAIFSCRSNHVAERIPSRQPRSTSPRLSSIHSNCHLGSPQFASAATLLAFRIPMGLLDASRCYVSGPLNQKNTPRVIFAS